MIKMDKLIEWFSKYMERSLNQKDINQEIETIKESNKINNIDDIDSEILLSKIKDKVKSLEELLMSAPSHIPLYAQCIVEECAELANLALTMAKFTNNEIYEVE
jgi:hypothetical protein